MATSSREARRRRIVERGADRLALITGRIHSLPPPPLSDVSPSADDVQVSSSENPQNDSTVESDKINTDNGESRAESASPKLETSIDTSRGSDKEAEDIQVQTDKINTDYIVEARVSRGKIFTPKKINSAIVATENTRICFSIMVAILVAFSYLRFPILGNTVIKNVIYYKPLYLVLFTGISVILKRLILEGRSVQRSDQKRNEVPSIGGFERAEQIGMALELGFCLKNITNAIFMDFSVYAIVLVCGLVFAQKFV